jgi:hypothetical protein
MNRERLSKLNEIAKSKGKLLLIESVDFLNTNYNLIENIQLPKDKPILVESAYSTPIKARGVLKNVPVTKFTQNKNGRIYSKRLWETVQARKAFEGGSCLADHAEKEGSTTRICGTWHNFKVNENYATADLYLIGEHGQLFLEAVFSRNKNLGLSTVGFGDFLNDGITVNPETYELSEESVCDWVLTPSQGVFATYENYVDTSNNYLENYREQISSENKYTNKVESNKFSNTQMDAEVKPIMNMNNDMLKLQEFNVKSHVKAALKESKRVLELKDIEAMRESQETLSSLIRNIPNSETLLDEKSKIENQIGLIESAIVSLIKEQSTQLQKASSVIKENSNKNIQILQEKNSLEKKLIEATTVVQKLKEYIEKEEKSFKESLGVAKNDIRLLEKEVLKRDESLKVFERSYGSMKHDINIFVMREKDVLSKLRKYSVTLKKIRESVKNLSKKDSRKVKEVHAQLLDAKKLIKIYKEKFTKNNSELIPLKKKYLEVVKEKNKIKETFSKLEMSRKKLSKENSSLLLENSVLKKTIKKLKEAHPDISKKQGYADYAGTLEDEFLAPDPAQQWQYDLDDRKKSKTKKENRHGSVMMSVRKLYENKVRQFPAIKSIKDHVLSSKNISEAVDKIDYFLSNSSISQPSVIKESTSNKNFNHNASYYPAGSFLQGRD